MRQKRFLVNGAEYHVTARINRQEYVLEPPAVKVLFLSVLKQAKSRYRFSVRNFCIMNNHIHLMIQPRANESLSRIMQWILSVFARRYNVMRGSRGHVWYDRFRSKAILSGRQRWKTFVYISENPVKAGITLKAGAYAYGGIHFMITGNTGLLEKFEQYLQHYALAEPHSVSFDPGST